MDQGTDVGEGAGMIVKVQLSLSTTESSRQVLIYNEDHSVVYRGDAPRKLVRIMGQRPKAFFYAEIDGKNIDLDTRSARPPWQKW